MRQCELTGPDDGGRGRSDCRGQNRCIGEVGRGRGLITEAGNLARDAEHIADPGVVGTGPDAFRIEQRAERNVATEIARQLVADLGVALSGDRADVDADRSAIWYRN
jgi:hypothetical protein